MAEVDGGQTDPPGAEYDNTEADHILGQPDKPASGTNTSVTNETKSAEADKRENPSTESEPVLVSEETTETKPADDKDDTITKDTPQGDVPSPIAAQGHGSDLELTTGDLEVTAEGGYTEAPEDEWDGKTATTSKDNGTATQEVDLQPESVTGEEALLEQTGVAQGEESGTTSCKPDDVIDTEDNVDGEDSESRGVAPDDERQPESVDESEVSGLRDDKVVVDDSPTISLAEEDQAPGASPSEEVREEAASLHSAPDSPAVSVTDAPCEGVKQPETDSDSNLSPTQQETDQPECDLISGETAVSNRENSESPASISSDDNTCNTNDSSAAVARSAAPPAAAAAAAPKKSSSFRFALGHLKQGIKSATKESFPIREALGQMKEGLRTAISETSTFLEGPQTPRPMPLHMSSSEASVSHTQRYMSSSRPQAVTDAAPSTVPEHVEGAGDVGSELGSVTSSDIPEDDLLSQLDAELEPEVEAESAVVKERVESDRERTPPPPRPPPPNGVRRVVLTEIPEYKELKMTCEQLTKELQEQKDQNTRLRSVHEAQDNALLAATQQADMFRKHLEDFKATSSEEVFITQIKALDATIADQQKEINAAQEKLLTHDKAAKDAVTKLQNELKTRVDQLTAANELAKKDKADMVLRYARAESKNIEMEQKMTKNDAKVKEMTKERDAMAVKCKALKADQVKCRELFEARSTEVLQMRRELEKQKELMVSQEGKTKWAHNKLKLEIDNHKETKAKMEEAVRKNKAARDEAEQIRRDCQSMIKCYQESEEIKSNSLDQELKNKETELMQHKQDKMDHQEIHNMLKRELETLKMKHKEMLEELKTWRDKKTLLDAERIIQEENLNKYRETLQKQKETNQDLEKRLATLEDIEKVVLDVKDKNTDLELRNDELEQEVTEVRADMEKCSTREQEHLLFTQKISDKNARLQSENTAFSNKVKGLTAENERLNELCENLTTKKDSLEKELAAEKKQRTKQVDNLTSQLEVQTKEVERLKIEVDDAQSEIKTLKRKHAANTKDLMRQLQGAKRRMENLEPKDVSSMGSRTSSNGSLDTMNGTRPASTSSQPVVEPEPFVEIVEVDKQMLIEKIVRLQKAHARKNEKMEFMEDHIQQLFAEVQKKTKIIQNYALREEAGAISPESTDTNKALLAKKGGIMASLYTSHQQDGAMTLDLSLSINSKLQAVLEDTLLKNITLKENLDTLGEEIARLSQENRAIQLSGHQET